MNHEAMNNRIRLLPGTTTVDEFRKAGSRPLLTSRDSI